MNILISPDSFKGSLTASQAAESISRACVDVFGIAGVKSPMADGGEGTLDTLIDTLHGRRIPVDAVDPYGNGIVTEYGVIDGDTAVIELASASGITLSERRDPLAASTYGTGHMIRAAYDAGYRKMLVAIGGSATNDGGTGMLSALGAVFRDVDGSIVRGSGCELSKIASVDLSGLPDVEFEVICDVTNPLLGKNGATAVYGPQKGVTEETFGELENGMANYARVMEKATGVKCHLPGSGAAGGVGYALVSAFGAKLMRGIDAVIAYTGLEKKIKDSDLVITGEGKLDNQSLAFGKVIGGILELTRKYGVPLIAFAGSITDDAYALIKGGDATMFPITDGVNTLEYAMTNAEKLLYGAAKRALTAVKIGKGL